jgi:hypothetical protein
LRTRHERIAFGAAFGAVIFPSGGLNEMLGATFGTPTSVAALIVRSSCRKPSMST